MANKVLLTVVNGDRVIINSNATDLDLKSVIVDGIQIKKTGSDLDMGNVKLTNVAAGSGAGHVVEYGQLNTALASKVSLEQITDEPAGFTNVYQATVSGSSLIANSPTSFGRALLDHTFIAAEQDVSIKMVSAGGTGSSDSYLSVAGFLSPSDVSTFNAASVWDGAADLIVFGIRLQDGQTDEKAYVTVSGTLVQDLGVHATGDIFEARIEGGTFKAYKNGSLVYTGGAATRPLNGGVVVLSGGATVSRLNSLSYSYLGNLALITAEAAQVAAAAAQSTANAALPSASFTDTAVTGKLITGFSSGSGTVAATDTILQAINKLDGNTAAKLDSSAFTDTAVTGKLITGFVSGAGTVADTDTILQAINKLDGNIAAIPGPVDPLATVITGFVSGAGTVTATDTILQAIDKLDGNTAAKLNSSAFTDSAVTGKLITGFARPTWTPQTNLTVVGPKVTSTSASESITKSNLEFTGPFSVSFKTNWNSGGSQTLIAMLYESANESTFLAGPLGGASGWHQGLEFWNDGTIYVYTGTSVSTVQTSSSSDVWKIASDGDTLTYYKNGSLFYTSSVPVTGLTLRFGMGTDVNGAYVEFVNTLVATDTILQAVEKLDSNVSYHEHDATYLKLSGGTMTGVLDMGVYEAKSSFDPSGGSTSTLVNKGYVDQLAITGGTVKEAILVMEQLVDGGSGGISAAEVFYIAGTNAVDGDTVVITNGVTTETYTFKDTPSLTFDVQIGVDEEATEANLATKINAESAAWSAKFVGAGLAFVDDSVVVVMRKVPASGTSTSRIYGTFATPGDAKVVEYNGTPQYTTGKAAITMPSADPGAGRFGFGRAKADLTDGELHVCLEANDVHSWNESADTWYTLSGSGSVPDATSASGGGTKGKVTVDSDKGLVVASGILSATVDATTIEFDPTAGPTKGQMRVKSGVFAAAGHNHDSAYLGITAKAADADKLDGIDSTGFSLAGHDHSGVYDPAGTAAGLIEDTIVDGVTTKAPSQNAVFDALALKANSADVAATSRGFTNDNAGTITIRQVAYVKSNGNIDLAKADAVATGADAILVMVKAASIASSASGACYVRGETVPGFSSLTVGATYFVSAATAGDITATAPSASGNFVYKVGRAVSATEILFEPEYRWSIA